MPKVLSFANLVAPNCQAFPSLEAAVNAGQAATSGSAATVRALPKDRRRDWFKLASSVWPCITLTEGVNPALRISRENPPQLLHGFAADYDNVGKRFTVAELTEIADRCTYPPAAGGASLSGEGVHAVWLFKEPIPVLGNADYAKRVCEKCYQNLRVTNFVGGFDVAFKTPDRLLSIDPENFGWLTSQREACLVDEVSTRMWAASVLHDFKFEGPALDLAKVYEKVEALFPGRWGGDFSVGSRGVRFWDSTASDPTAAVVTPSGMVYFTDGGGFRSWASIFGGDFVSKISADSLAEVTEPWFYDATNREYVYWHQPTGAYDKKNRTQLSDRLELAGVEKEADKKRAIVYVEDFKKVTAVVALANQKRGLITQGSHTYLNATQTAAVAPTKGDCPFIVGLLEAMFGSEQLPYFLAWLQDSVRCALECEPSYAQAIFLAGGVEVGKSLLQFRVITPLLGGRDCDPMGYLLGETTFNSECADSGHWLISDSEGARNSAQRSSFTQKIKAATANPSMAVHAKFEVPVTLLLNSRLTFSFNRNAECLSVIPRLGSDILGKLSLFNVLDHEFLKGFDRRQIESSIKAQLPAFAWWLLEEYKAPADVLSCGRYRTKSYHSPELLNVARASQDSSELLGWLSIMFGQSELLRKDFLEQNKAAELTAAHWLQLLTTTTGHHHSLTPNKLSAHFQALARQFPDSIKSRFDSKSKVYVFSVDYRKLTESNV